MKCGYPIRLSAGIDVGCGQCTNCRINKRREWVGRMLLELAEHPAASFITLTYNQENVPKCGNVFKTHLQKFLKRLRKKIHPRKIRYFACGEYGDQSQRPHYHAILYGIHPTEQELIQQTWNLGYVMVGTAEQKSMSYCASYVVKKMTKPGDQRLNGRNPEFCIMSKGTKEKPGGLGYGIIRRIEAALSTPRGLAANDSTQGKFKQFRTGGQKYPIGAYLKKKIDDEINKNPIQRRENVRRTVDQLYDQELTVHTTETERKKRATRQAAIALSKSKKTLTKRSL